MSNLNIICPSCKIDLSINLQDFCSESCKQMMVSYITFNSQKPIIEFVDYSYHFNDFHFNFTYYPFTYQDVIVSETFAKEINPKYKKSIYNKIIMHDEDYNKIISSQNVHQSMIDYLNKFFKYQILL